MDDLFEKLKTYVGDDYNEEQEPFLRLLIEDAIEEVCNELYPYGFSCEKEKESIKNIALQRYGSKIRKIAEYHYDKQGAEGVNSISENGTSFSYESSGTPSSYLRGIIPVARVI